MASFDCGPTKRDFSPHETARIIQFNQSRGSAIQALLVPEPLPIPVPFQRNASSKRKEPKNFQKNHLTVLRDMQYQNKVKKELEGRKTKLKKLSIFKNVSSKVFNSEGFSKENRKDVDTIHPTEKYSDEISSIENSFGVEAENNSSASEMASSKNYILKNKIDAIRPRPRIPTKPKPKRHHDSYGKVPEYVIKRKLELAERDRMRNDEDTSVQIPEGMMILPKQERLDTLNLLRQKEDDTKRELQSLSFTGDSLKLKQRRKKLENKLQEVADAIILFQKDVVYVQKP